MRETIVFSDPYIVKLFLHKRVGDKIGINLIGNIDSIGADSLRMALESATVGSTVLSFREAAESADNEVNRVTLATEPSPG